MPWRLSSGVKVVYNVDAFSSDTLVLDQPHNGMGHSEDDDFPRSHRGWVSFCG